MKRLVALVSVIALIGTAGVAEADVFMKHKRHVDAVKTQSGIQPASDVIVSTWMTENAMRTDTKVVSMIVKLDEKVVIIASHKKKTIRRVSLDVDEIAAEVAAKDKETAAEVAAKDKETAAEVAAKDKETAAEVAAKDKEIAGEVAAKDKKVAGEVAVKDKEIAAEKQPEVQGRMGGTAKTNVSVAETGERKKIGDWNCTKYIQRMRIFTGSVTTMVWATEDLKIDNDRYAHFTAAQVMALSMMAENLDQVVTEMKKVKGVRVLEISSNAQRRSTNQLIEFKEGKAPAGTFDLPQGYTEK